MRDQLAGRRVFRETWENGDICVSRAFIGAGACEVASLDDFIRDSQPGDYLFSSTEVTRADLVLATSDNRHWIYQRNDVNVVVTAASTTAATLTEPTQPQPPTERTLLTPVLRPSVQSNVRQHVKTSR
jgi:hypothetical protein